jgi:hypothetical protein
MGGGIPPEVSYPGDPRLPPWPRRAPAFRRAPGDAPEGYSVGLGGRATRRCGKTKIFSHGSSDISMGEAEKWAAASPRRSPTQEIPGCRPRTGGHRHFAGLRGCPGGLLRRARGKGDSSVRENKNIFSWK